MSNAVPFLSRTLQDLLSKAKRNDLDNQIISWLASVHLYSVPNELLKQCHIASEKILYDAWAEKNPIRPEGNRFQFWNDVQPAAAHADNSKLSPVLNPSLIFYEPNGWELPKDLASLREVSLAEGDRNRDLSNARVTAHMILRDAEGLQIVEFISKQSRTDVILQCYNGQWKLPTDSSFIAVPWLLLTLANRELARQVRVSNGAAHALRKLGKKHKLLLERPAYYVIDLDQPKVIKTVAKFARKYKARRPQHAYDVAAHHRLVRLYRGQLPLDPKRERMLLKRKYTICVDGQLDSSTQAMLAARGHDPVRAKNEWLACLFVPVKPTRRNKDKPFVPALRVTKVTKPVGLGSI